MYFLSLLATPPSVTLAQQRVSTTLLKISFPVEIQKAVSKLFSLSCLMNHNFVSSGLQEVLEGDFFGLWTTSEMWVAVFWHRNIQYSWRPSTKRETCSTEWATGRAVLEFSHHNLYSFSFIQTCWSSSLGIAVSAGAGIGGCRFGEFKPVRKRGFYISQAQVTHIHLLNKHFFFYIKGTTSHFSFLMPISSNFTSSLLPHSDSLSLFFSCLREVLRRSLYCSSIGQIVMSSVSPGNMQSVE